MASNTVTTDKRKRKRRPKPGDTAALRRILWQAALELEKLLAEEDMDAKLRTASTLATLGGVYLKAVEQADLEKQLAALKVQMNELTQKGNRQDRGEPEEPGYHHN